MIQVYKIDEYGFYTFETYKVEEPNEFEITTPCKTCEEDDFYKPKWEGDRWVEGATQEDINEINKIDICPTKTLEERVEELEQENKLLKQENKMLYTQVEANASNNEFLESCMMEMAQVVYA